MFVYVTCDFKVFKTKSAVEQYVKERGMYLTSDMNFHDGKGWRKYIKVKVREEI